MAGSAEPRDDSTSSSSLLRRLKRLNLGSPSPSSSSDHTSLPSKPLPAPPLELPPQNAPYLAKQTVSLPPYLAHLAEHSSSCSTRQPTYLSFPQPQTLYSSIDVHAHPHRLVAPTQTVCTTGIAPNNIYTCANILPPRPPAFVLSTKPPACGSQDIPSSLRPASIQLGTASKHKVPYPWELAPQSKPGHGANDQIVSSTCHSNEKKDTITVQNSVLEPTTPSHSRQSAHISSSDARATMTPKGSQTDPRFPPAKGQCWGITKKNLRCTKKGRAVNCTGAASPKSRRISAGYDRGASAPARLAQKATASDPLVVSDSDDDDPQSPTTRRTRQCSVSHCESGDADTSVLSDDIDEVFCGQHIAEAKKWPGFYHSYSGEATSCSISSNILIKYEDWLTTPCLDDHTQVLLRNCMRRPLTEMDRNERGYLYIHELLAFSTPTHVCLKVGRSNQVFRRVGEWNAQCRSKQPLLRAIYPSHDGQQLMPGMDTPTMQGVPFSRRWEALVHLELKSLGKRLDDECADCGKRHREIFLLPHSSVYRNASQPAHHDAFDLANDVIVKWLRFVQLLAGPNSTSSATGTTTKTHHV